METVYEKFADLCLQGKENISNIDILKSLFKDTVDIQESEAKKEASCSENGFTLETCGVQKTSHVDILKSLFDDIPTERQGPEIKMTSISNSISVLSKEEKYRFNEFVTKAKEKQEAGEIQEAIELFRKAYLISDNEKIAKKILKLETILISRNTLDDGFVQDTIMKRYFLDQGFSLSQETYLSLFPYQRDGIKWFWGLHKKKRGGILGDEMVIYIYIYIFIFIYIRIYIIYIYIQHIYIIYIYIYTHTHTYIYIYIYIYI